MKPNQSFPSVSQDDLRFVVGAVLAVAVVVTFVLCLHNF